MPQSQPDWPSTLDEFRAWHERQPEVWEFIDGVPKRMAPSSKAHTLIKSNVHAALAQALEGRAAAPWSTARWSRRGAPR